MTKKLLLLGATGQTGSHILPMALEKGLHVRCYVRSPDKIPAEHRDNDAVEVVQGDFSDTAAVEAAVEGMDVIICVGGGPSNLVPGVMLGVAEALMKGMRAHGVKRLVYQAGAFSPEPGKQNPFMTRWFLRPLLGRMFGITKLFEENDAVMAMVSQADDLDWTFTRPGQIEDNPSTGELEASDAMSSKCTFVDLAKLNLDIALSDQHVRAFPYVNY